MFRGIKTFRCDKCGAKFSAVDIEYAATAFSMPQPCPYCNSNHTMPVGIFGFLGRYNPNRLFYKQIWNTTKDNA